MIYEGNDKYIFISYAHKDADSVLPVLGAMADAGFRLWYDSGIEAGTEWPEYIEERLMNASVVLVFMTPAAVESRNCRNEINFALELKKEILVIYLEETTLLKGMRLQLNSSQSLFRKHHSSQETFVRELINAKIVQSCRTEQASAAPAQKPVAAQQPAKTKSGSKTPLYALLGALLLAVVVLIGILASGGFGGGSAPTESQPLSTEPSVTETASLEMSDDLTDYIVELDGVLYQFPCSFTDLTDNGWTISASDCNAESLLAGCSEYEYEMTKNGMTMDVTSYNLSGNAVAIKDCLVSGISCSIYDGVAVKLAKDVTLHMTPEEIVTALGTPNARDDYDDRVVMYYQQSDTSGVKFFIYTTAEDQKYSRVTVENHVNPGNIQTETNPEVPEYLSAYQAPTELGTDFKNGVIRLGGDLYQIPAPVSSFLDNGWQIIHQPNFVCSGNADTIRMQRDGAQIDLYISNLAEYQTLAANCVVYKINVAGGSNAEVELPNGVRLGMTEDEVVAIAGDEFNFYEGLYTNSWTYSEYSEASAYIDIKVDIQTKLVTGITVSREYWPE